MTSPLRSHVRPFPNPRCHSYPISAEAKYQARDGGRVLKAGTGWTTAISSTDVVFESADGPSPGSQVELAINWPVRLDHKIDLKLWIVGRAVRVEGNRTFIDIQRHEFRTSARPAERAALAMRMPRIMTASSAAR